MADWLKIKAEYISGCGSMRELAEKYDLSISAIKRRSAAEGWKANRTKTAPKVHQKTVQKIIEKTADHEADRITRMLCVSDKLLRRIDEAVDQLDTQTAKRTVKHKTVLYEEREDGSRGKVTGEQSHEVTDLVGVPGLPIDRLGAKLLADALKSLHAVSAAAQQDTDRQDVPVILDAPVGKGGT